jgi:hypothetical protein
VLPSYPHHAVQRGHNRQVVFAAEQDYQRYITDLRELKNAFCSGQLIPDGVLSFASATAGGSPPLN